MEQDILTRINQLKSNVQHFWHRFSDHDFELPRKTLHDVSDVVKDKFQKLTESDEALHQIKIDNYHYESHYPDDDDLPLTLAKDPEPGVRFYDTENSPDAYGRPKAVPHELDKFGDEDDEVLEEDIKRRRPVRKKKPTASRSKRTLH